MGLEFFQRLGVDWDAIHLDARHRLHIAPTKERTRPVDLVLHSREQVVERHHIGFTVVQNRQFLC